jgi:hypothetical protein
MSASRITLAILGVAALFAAGWLAVRAIDEALAMRRGWEIVVSDPILVGDIEDPFAYTGGEDVRPLDGEGRIRVSEGGARGFVRLAIQLDGATAVPDAGEPWIGTLSLRSEIEEDATVLSDVTTHGETARGEFRLPKTYAVLLGTGPYDLRLDGEPLRSAVRGTWTLAHALRREDGAIRNQGLVFSPLLRDDTVFADPDRLEFTLLLYEPVEDGTARVALHLVFRGVEMIRSPAATTSAE